MNEQNQIIDENTSVICPWCKAATSVSEDANELQCSICQRIITEEDIEESVHQDEK